MVSELLNMDWRALWATFRTETARTLRDFYLHVDWSEKWIRFVLFILAVWCVMIVVYRYVDCGSSWFLLVVIIIGSNWRPSWSTPSLCLELRDWIPLASIHPSLHLMARRYWRLFSTRDYFDENGFFISFFLSIPMLLITAVQIVGCDGDGDECVVFPSL